MFTFQPSYLSIYPNADHSSYLPINQLVTLLLVSHSLTGIPLFFIVAYLGTYLHAYYFKSILYSHRHTLYGFCPIIEYYIYFLPVLSTDVRTSYCFDTFDINGCGTPRNMTMTMSQCCCTKGQGWGDPCELCPKPNNGKAMC